MDGVSDAAAVAALEAWFGPAGPWPRKTWAPVEIEDMRAAIAAPTPRDALVAFLGEEEASLPDEDGKDDLADMERAREAAWRVMAGEVPTEPAPDEDREPDPEEPEDAEDALPVGEDPRIAEAEWERDHAGNDDAPRGWEP